MSMASPELEIGPTALPDGWQSEPLGEVIAPSKEKVEPEQCPDAPYLSLEHVEANTGRIIGRGLASDVKSTKCVFRAGDVLYGKLRPYLNKVCIPDFSGVCSTDFLVFPRQSRLDNRLLRHFLSLPPIVQFATDQSKGVQLPRVSFAALATISLPLPPLPEQQRIVARIEELLAHVNAAREHLARVPVILKRFRQSVVAAACSGRLTEDWRDRSRPIDEPTAAIVAHHKACWLKNHRVARSPYVPPTFAEGPRPLPFGWKWVSLGILGENCFATVQTGPFGALLHRDEFVEAGVPVVAVGNLTGMGFSAEGLYFVTPEKGAQLSRFDVKAGDVLFARSGATLGKVCVAPAFVDSWRMTGHILRVRLARNLVIPDYLVYCLHGDPAVREQVTGSTRGVTRPGFNTSLLESVSVPLAPLAEQHEIVRRVEALFALADTIEQCVGAATARADHLTQAILAKAFRGELVPNTADLAGAMASDGA